MGFVSVLWFYHSCIAYQLYYMCRHIVLNVLYVCFSVLVVDDVSNQSVAHVVVRPQTLKPYPEFTVDELLDQIKTTLATNSWPVWQVGTVLLVKVNTMSVKQMKNVTCKLCKSTGSFIYLS